MLRLLFVLMALSLWVGVAQADVIYVEDFEDYQGNAGFDPLFNHSFSSDPDVTARWKFVNSNNPGEYLLSLKSGTTDVITFHLPLTSTVVYASVGLDGPFHPGSTASVRFVGSESSWVIGPDNYGQSYVEITSTEIGSIQQIELYNQKDPNTGAYFSSVTIGVYNGLGN